MIITPMIITRMIIIAMITTVTLIRMGIPTAMAILTTMAHPTN